MNLLTETEQFKNTFESMQRDYDRGLCQKKIQALTMLLQLLKHTLKA